MSRVCLRDAIFAALLLLCHCVNVCNGESNSQSKAIKIGIIIAGITVPTVVLLCWFCCCSRRGKAVSSKVRLKRNNMYEFHTSPIEVKSLGQGENFAYVSLEPGAYQSKTNETDVLPEKDSGNELNTATSVHGIQISVWEADDNEVESNAREQDEKQSNSIEKEEIKTTSASEEDIEAVTTAAEKQS